MVEVTFNELGREGMVAYVKKENHKVIFFYFTLM